MKDLIPVVSFFAGFGAIVATVSWALSRFVGLQEPLLPSLFFTMFALAALAGICYYPLHLVLNEFPGDND